MQSRSPQPPQRRDMMADYVPVNERIAAFYAKHPEGSIQSELVELTEARVVMRALAYRTPDDARPGIGYSSMNIPGSTSFTRGSEIENTETSAWGRAIAALGFEVKRGIATAEEVENKRDEQPQRPTRPTPLRPSSTDMPDKPSDDEIAALHADEIEWGYTEFRDACKRAPLPHPDLKAVVSAGSRLFPTKGLELTEPKAWRLTDREWRQLFAVVTAR